MTASPAGPDPRWTFLARLRDAAMADLTLAVELWERRAAPPGAFPAEALGKAIQKSLQDAYASIEKAAGQMLDLAGEPKPVGSHWHEQLLVMVTTATASRPAFAPDLIEPLDELRRFRHVAIHGYLGFRLERAAPAIAAAGCLIPALPAAFDTFGREFGLL